MARFKTVSKSLHKAGGHIIHGHNKQTLLYIHTIIHTRRVRPLDTCIGKVLEIVGSSDI